ncbi:hypothetical protein SK571_40585 [Lentzea sp. BCCO 10_0798]|uniref:Uncharacterized protein n=1 Tax=Lentzea kristufekii TaxID=3095430 RepID=A0ABU4U6T3_9PSEU|nr:hypothetical protein [Lentzea sp. BCCO 10_0798]MDX8055711.1 hypothetical protein [Lentzea sp. BCCO 10_0798]
MPQPSGDPDLVVGPGGDPVADEEVLRQTQGPDTAKYLPLAGLMLVGPRAGRLLRM